MVEARKMTKEKTLSPPPGFAGVQPLYSDILGSGKSATPSTDYDLPPSLRSVNVPETIKKFKAVKMDFGDLDLLKIMSGEFGS